MFEDFREIFGWIVPQYTQLLKPLSYSQQVVLNCDCLLSQSFGFFQVKTAYRTLMKKIVTLLGANETGINLMDQVYEFEAKLANVS